MLISGIRDGNFGKHRTNASSQATKRSASLWDSIKGVLGYASVEFFSICSELILHTHKPLLTICSFRRKRQSREGFASVSVDRPPLLWGSFQPDPLHMASIFTVLVVTCICTVMGKTSNLTLLQQKDGSPRTHRTKKNSVDRNTMS